MQLARLLSSFVDATESARDATHGSAGRGALTCIPSNRATNRAERRATSRTFDNVGLRGLVRFGLIGTRGGGRRSAGIESGLLDRPGMALIAILVLQRLTLPLCRIDIELTALSVSYSGQYEAMSPRMLKFE